MSRFIPQTILITGATGGIGSALAKRYAAHNTTLILTGRHVERLAHVASWCRERGATVVTHAFDIGDLCVLKEWLDELLRNYTIDLVIANAGISAGVNQHGELEQLENTNQLLKVNLLSVINLIYPVIAQMQARKKGQIALMSSLAAFRGLPQSPAYCASKAALRIYGESLRPLLRKHGIHVAVICPGFVQTAMSDKVSGPKPYLMSADQAAKIIEQQLQKKKSEITFPKPLKYTIKLLSFLPTRWVDYLLVKIKSYVDEA